jgi:hypothetical protein
MKNVEGRLERLESAVGDSSSDAEGGLNRAVMLCVLGVPEDRRTVEEYHRRVSVPMEQMTGTEAERFRAVLATSADLRELADRANEVWVTHRDAVLRDRGLVGGK